MTHEQEAGTAMDALDGEIIENLLWEAGVDFSHFEDEDGYGLEFRLFSCRVMLRDVYFVDSRWHVDREFLTFQRELDNGEITLHDEPVDDENEFLHELLLLEPIR